MAFKPVYMASQVTYVSHADPAVDAQAMMAREIDGSEELQKISDTERREFAAIQQISRKYMTAAMQAPSSARDLLIFKPGEQPTEFLLGVIPPDEAVRLSDECKLGKADSQSNLLHWRAFLAGVRGVENFGTEKPPTRKVGTVDYVEPAWLRANFGGRGLRLMALNVGAVIWAWNQLTEDEVKN